MARNVDSCWCQRRERHGSWRDRTNKMAKPAAKRLCLCDSEHDEVIRDAETILGAKWGLVHERSGQVEQAAHGRSSSCRGDAAVHRSLPDQKTAQLAPQPLNSRRKRLEPPLHGANAAKPPGHRRRLVAGALRPALPTALDYRSGIALPAQQQRRQEAPRSQACTTAKSFDPKSHDLDLFTVRQRYTESSRRPAPSH